MDENEWMGPEPVYSDGLQVGTAPFTVTLTFTIAPTARQMELFEHRVAEAERAGEIPPAPNLRPGEPREVPFPPPLPRVVADVRMSPEHAKIMSMILRRQLKDFEHQQGTPIPVHPQVARQLGLSPHEDW